MPAISSDIPKILETGPMPTDKLSYTDQPLGVSQLLSRAELHHDRATTEIPTEIGTTIVNKSADLNRDSIVVLKQWDGVITEISRGTFIAELYETDRRRDYPTEIGEFDLDEVQPRDVDLVAVGAAFRYIIGRRIRSHGQRDTIYMISFRRLPTLRKDTIAQAKQKARIMRAKLNWE